MKAGEYIGKDGQLYGWKELPEPYCRAGLGYDHCIKNRPNNGPDWTLEPIRYGDVDAAKAALDALVEQESGEWVEIRQNDEEYTGLRCRVDGSQPQWFKDFDGKWHDEEAGEDTEWLVAYRKGREVAQQESADLRDAARELVRTINTMPTVTFDFGTLPIMQGGYHLAEDVRVDVNARHLMKWMDTLDKAAKALEGKL